MAYGLPAQNFGLQKSRPISLAANMGADPRPTARRPPPRPMQEGRGRPRTTPGVTRRRAMQGGRGGETPPKLSQPIIDPMSHGNVLAPEMALPDTMLAASRIDGVGVKGSERGASNSKRRRLS